jgi:hypothetical protein
VCHIIYIDSSRCDIGSYKDIHFLIFEALQKMLSLFLCEIAVQTFCTISFIIQF